MCLCVYIMLYHVMSRISDSWDLETPIMAPPIPACVALGERVAPLCSGSPRQTKPFIKRQSLMDFEARTVDFPRLQGSGPKFTHIPADKLKCHGKCIQFALKSMDSMAWGITVQRSCTRHRLNAGLAARFVCFHPWKGYKSHHRKRTLLLVGMESQHSPMTEITTRITLVAKASQHSNHQHETVSSPLSL